MFWHALTCSTDASSQDIIATSRERNTKASHREGRSTTHMSNMPDHEHPSTYFVQNRSSEEEMTRLQIQDQMVTTSMGGVLPEQSDPTIFQRVLDVGCGTGWWVREG